MRLRRYCVMLKVMLLIPSTGGSSMNNCYCLIVPEDYLLFIPAFSTECERHFSAFNARNIITSQRNMMFPETVQALSIVLEGYKNKLIQ